MKKTILLASTLTLALGSIAQAGSWGFSLGDGSGFYYNNNQRQCAPVYSAPVYAAPRPVYYTQPAAYYQPQTVYMQPYQQMRPAPVYYTQPTVIYSQQPVIYRESHGHCGKHQRAAYPNRW